MHLSYHIQAIGWTLRISKAAPPATLKTMDVVKRGLANSCVSGPSGCVADEAESGCGSQALCFSSLLLKMEAFGRQGSGGGGGSGNGEVGGGVQKSLSSSP